MSRFSLWFNKRKERQNYSWCLLLVWLLSFATGSSVVWSNDNSLLYREMCLVGGYSDRDDWVGEKRGAVKNSVGMEFLRKFSNDYGDFLTCDLQLRLGYDISLDSNEAWGLEVHNAWADYKTGLGRNIRIGHFSPFFGLEPTVDTHGTLFQTMAVQDIGFKKDWGVGYRNTVSALDFECGVQIGSGMGIERIDSSHLLSARLGDSRNPNFLYGLSILYGDLLQSEFMRTVPEANYDNDSVTRKRAGLDVRILHGPLLVMGEVSSGWNEDNRVAGAMLQADWTVSSFQALTFQLQGRYWSDDPGVSERTSASTGLGFSYQISSSWVLRSAVFSDVEQYPGENDTLFFVQLYYFGR